MPGGGLPWQVHEFAGGNKEGRLRKTLLGFAVLGLGAWWWSRSSQREIAEKQEAKAAQFGSHGEKAQYGRDFQPSTGEHFPGIPSPDTNVRGGHAGGTKS